MLWDAFKYEILPTTEQRPITGSGAALAYELATAVANLAREQMQFEQRLNDAARWASGIEARMTALEVRTSTANTISETQATEIQLAVKTVAQALIERGAQNGYQRVYGELYRRYGIAAYRALPRNKYEDACGWLRNWHAEITSSGE